MERKVFPQEPKNEASKVPSGRSNFKSAKRIVEFHGSTPASACVSFRELFDNHVTELCTGISDEQKSELWLNVSETMLREPSEKLEEIIKNNLHF